MQVSYANSSEKYNFEKKKIYFPARKSMLTKITKLNPTVKCSLG